MYLFLVSFLSATLFPLGSEALLLFNLSNGLNIYLILLFATIGNSLGSIVNYWIGLKGEEYLLSKNILKKKSLDRSKRYFDKYGAYTILLSWVPIIGDPITLIAGALKYDFKKFVVLVMIAKFSRYLFLVLSFLYFS